MDSVSTELRQRLPGLLSAAADVALGRPGLRTARFLAESWLGNGASSRPSLSLALKVAADESFRTLMVALSYAPSRAELLEITAELDVAERMFGKRGWIEDPLRYHRRPPALRTPKSRRVKFWGSDYSHLRFESGYQPRRGEPGRQRWLSYQANRTAHAWVLRHRGRPRPWLVCVHGFRMGWPTADFTAFRAAWLHGALGLNVAIPVLPLHGDRKVGRRSGDGFFAGQVLDTIHAEAQALWDLRRLLSWIRSVGGDNIGAYGVSLGGYTTALLAGFDGDLSCAIAGMPPVCFPSMLQRHAPAQLLRGNLEAGLDWERIRRVTRVISPLAIEPIVAPERRYMFAGLADRMVPREHFLELWDHWSRPKMLWFDGSHLSCTWEGAVREFVHRSLYEAGLLRLDDASAPDLH